MAGRPLAKSHLRAIMNMEPKRAIAYLKRKGYAISWDFHEMDAAAHARAFTVAKATSLDILHDLKTGMKDRSLKEYQRELEPILKAKGWWGKKEVLDADTGEVKQVQLGSPHRLKTIYETNMQSAYMAGRYVDAMEAIDSHPYALYVAVMDQSTRPSHAAMNGRVFRLDDPVWDHITPPNGYGCRCRMVTLSEAEVKRRGLVVESSTGKLGTTQVPSHRDPDTGKVVTKEVTTVRTASRDGQHGSFRPDAGFDGGPAGSHLMDDVLYQKARRALPSDRQAVDAVRDALLSPLRLKAWQAFVERTLTPGAKMANQSMSIGIMDSRDRLFAQRQGAEPLSGVIYVRDGLIGGVKADRHAAASNALSAAEWAALPARLAKPQQVLWDKQKRNFLYILKSDDGRATKLAVRYNRLKTGAVRVDDAATVFKVEREDIRAGIKGGRLIKVR